MRVIAGEWRGRRLLAPPGDATRPTADRTRETLFSMLVSRLGSFERLRVADLFAGSGAIGIEALSRGAEHVIFVENERAALRAIAANLAAFKATERAQVMAGSALRLPSIPVPVDLLFADPPYTPGSGNAVVTALLASNWLVPGALVAIETARGDPVDPAGLAVEAERDTGRARLTLLRA